jgi:nitrous oxide reductase accessory protein NosL
MGTGIASFASESDASQFAAEQDGKVFSFQEVLDQSSNHSMGG